MLVDCDAELVAKNSFDAIDIVFHENEFLFHVCHALQEFFQRIRQFTELLHEALFQLGKALVHCRREGDILSDEAFFDPLVLGGKASVHFRDQGGVLLFEAMVHGVQNDGGLL